MRIFLIGQAAFGADVLRRLLENGENIVGVSAPGPSLGGQVDLLWALAEEKSLPIFATRELKKPDVFAQYRATQPELNVMAFVTDIIRDNVLDTPTKGTIQYHPSLLPKHRGASAMNWAIIQGEDQTGLTVFWVDSGVDTGPLLLQKQAEITSDDTLGTLYFGKLFPMGVEAMAEAVDMVRNGTATSVPQNEADATYEGICNEADVRIDWKKPAEHVYNLIRGSNPQPGAWTTLRSKALKVFDCKLLSSPVANSPGQVSAVSETSFTVALNGGALQISRIQSDGEGKLKAVDFIAAGRVNSGDWLGL